MSMSMQTVSHGMLALRKKLSYGIRDKFPIGAQVFFKQCGFSRTGVVIGHDDLTRVQIQTAAGRKYWIPNLRVIKR